MADKGANPKDAAPNFSRHDDDHQEEEWIPASQRLGKTATMSMNVASRQAMFDFVAKSEGKKQVC